MTPVRACRPPSEHAAARAAVALLMIALLSAGGTSAAGGQAQIRATNSRSYTSPKQAIAVNGVWSTWLKEANIVQMAVPGGVNAQVVLKTGLPGASLARWMATTIARTARPTTVQIATFDYDMRMLDAVTLAGAQIQEIDLPGADASSKDPAHFTVRFYPARVQQGIQMQGAQEPTSPERSFLPSNFRLEIDGIDCSRVATVGPLAITFPPNAGIERTPALLKAPPVTYPPLVVTVSRAYAAPFQQWLTTGGLKNGTLTFLSPDLKSTLFVVKFTGLRAQTFANDPTTAGSQNVLRSTVTMSITGLSVSEPTVRSVVMP